MSAVSLRYLLAAAALFAIAGCSSGEPERDGPAAAAPATVPEQKPASAAASATNAPSGLAIGGLLGPVPDRSTRKPDAEAVRGRVFNGAYAVELAVSDDRRARAAIHTVLEWLPVGRMKIWRNPDNGTWGTVTATRTYQDANGSWCREYRQTVTIGGDENQDNGMACRRTDGVWQPVSG